MGSRCIVMREECRPTVGRRVLCDDDRGQANAGFELGVERLRDTCRAGRRVVLWRPTRLTREHRRAGRRHPGGNRPRPGVTIVQFHQRSKQQQQLRKNRNACQRAPDRSCQLAPHAESHNQ